MNQHCIIKSINCYSAWFCPYAQRTWITLNYLQVPNFKIIESLKINPTTMAYIKDSTLLQLNPKGLVPTMEVFLQPTEPYKNDGGNYEDNFVVISDSIKCVDWLFDKYSTDEDSGSQEENSKVLE
eukprot:TRINITY_DN5306_c1_g1_i2.p1 TRINITY_DN5306_c1_g1~~TRINITY_DN5306_c1_g1_i2.p1  ORF type:complete len:139 (-),score=3.23 TRINITY_DN5306_c1_g1_i2:17-391(-)